MIAEPMGWFAWNFRLQEPEGVTVGELRISWWRQRGSVTIGGVMYTIHRDGMLGPFVLEAPDGTSVASAIKPSAFLRAFTVEGAHGPYELHAASPLTRRFEVHREGRRVGSIAPTRWMRRRAQAELAEDLAPELQAFMVWLTLLLWKRELEGSN